MTKRSTIPTFVLMASILCFHSNELLAVSEQSDSGTNAMNRFESPRYGIRTTLPESWEFVVREKDEMVFVCRIEQPNQPDRPGVMACEIAIAPESLEEYRKRIEGNAKRGTRKGDLIRNEILDKSAEGTPERLETVWEFRLPGGETWREVSVLIIRGRHLYTFTLNVDSENLNSMRQRFDKVISETEFTTPDSGAAKVGGAATNRWIQNEYQFVVDLPEGWAALLAPNEVAVLYANGPAKGIWADNMLVLASKPGKIDYGRLAETLPKDLESVEPNCKVLSSRVVKAPSGKDGLETIVEVKRGPFSMTIHEWRFAGDRFDYELKFTVETERYETLKPHMIRCYQSFVELTEDSPAP